MRFFWYLAVSVFICLLLVACNSAVKRDSYVFQTAKKVSPNEGAVILRVVTNASQVSGQSTGWKSFYVYRKTGNISYDGQEERLIYSLPVVAGDSPSDLVFGGPLPEGRYYPFMLSTLPPGRASAHSSSSGYQQQHGAEVSTGEAVAVAVITAAIVAAMDPGAAYQARLPDTFGAFEVQRGKFTDLGGIIYQPMGDPSEYRYLAARTTSYTNNIKAAFDRIENPFSHFDREDALSWPLGIHATGNERLIDTLRKAPFANVSQRAIELEDERLVYPTMLGVLLIRNPDGSMKIIQAGSPVPLLSLARINSKEFLVVNAAREIWRVDIQAESAKEIDTQLPAGFIESIHADGESVFLSMIRREARKRVEGRVTWTEDVLTVYSANPEPGMDWDLELEYESSTALPALIRLDKDFQILERKSRIRKWDPADGVGESRSVGFSTLHEQRNGAITGNDSLDGLGGSVYAHADSIPDSAFLGTDSWSNAAVDDDGNIYVIGRNFDNSRERSELNISGLLKSVDAGSSWRKIADVPDECAMNAGLDISAERLVLSCRNGMIMSADLHGKAWRTDLDPYEKLESLPIPPSAVFDQAVE